MDQENVTYMYNGMLLSHERNDTWGLAEMWLGLETVIQIEVSQKKNSKYHILTYICRI